MKNRRSSLVLAVMLVAALAAGQKSDPAEVLLKAAMQKELVDGDLKAAIEQYKKIAARPGGNRVVAAKALLQMGRCYEKLGKAEARKAYEQILRDYADQRELVAAARARLAALAQPAAPKRSEAITVRQVWADPEADDSGAPSADGRFVSMMYGWTGDLAVRDVATGQIRRLTNKGTWAESPAFAVESAVSPDGKLIAYVWTNNTNEDPYGHLRVMAVNGSEPRILYRNAETEWIAPASWSPDGRHIAAVLRRRDQINQFILVSVADGSARVLKTLNKGRHWSKLSFSPDGRYLVCDYPPKPGAPERDIFLLSVDGSGEVPLVEHPADDYVLGWSPDGTRVLFASDRTGNIGVWAISVENGKPQGSPVLVKADVGRIRPIGITRDGSFFYGLDTGSDDVYIATLDPATGKLVTPPGLATHRFLGSNEFPHWSPDGRYLGYKSRRGTVAASGVVLSIVSVESGEERDVVVQLADFSSPRWSPEGRSIEAIGRPKDNGPPGIYKIDPRSGEAALFVPRRTPFTWTPDGKVIFRSLGFPPNLEMINVETGEAKSLYRPADPEGTVRSVALSPDGRRLAFVVPRSLFVVPVDGGEPRLLLRTKEVGFRFFGSVAWTSDGRHILFVKGPDTLGPGQLFRISREGGEPQGTGLMMDEIRELSVHPDGRRIAFTAGRRRKTEVWVMENFLPALKAAR